MRADRYIVEEFNNGVWVMSGAFDTQEEARDLADAIREQGTPSRVIDAASNKEIS